MVAIDQDKYDYDICGYLGCIRIATHWAEQPDGFLEWATDIHAMACDNHVVELDQTFGNVRTEIARLRVVCFHCGSDLGRKVLFNPDFQTNYCVKCGEHLVGCDNNCKNNVHCGRIGCLGAARHSVDVRDNYRAGKYAYWRYTQVAINSCDEHEQELRGLFGAGA